MFSKVMKKMLALALSLTFVLALIPATASAAEGTFAEMFSGDITISSDYDADATDDSAAVTVAEESVTLRVWWIKNSCGYTHNNATVTLKNTSGDGLTVKFDFGLKGYYKQVKLGDFTFTTNGVAELALGIDEEIDITLYNDGSNDNEDDVEDGEAVLTLDNFVLTPFHICSVDSHVMGEEPSCVYDGWKDYYMCRCEETFYADEDGTQQITDLEAWKQGDGKLMASHNYGELIEQNDGTHTADTLENGMKAHYFCDVCETYFTEEKVATTKDDLVIEVDHNYGELVEQNDGTHTADTLENGMKAHYFCDVCETYFTEEKVATTKDDLVIEVDHNYGELVEQNDGTHTADTLENGMKAHYFCDVCDTYFTEEKVATTKDDLVIEVAHDYTVENGYIGDDGHANTCECGARGTLYDHTPDIPAPTETEDQKCFVCDHILEPATGHLCVNHLTKVGEKPADCDEDGNTEYYECSCGKYFEDETATVEITDKESVIIPSGHSHGKEWKRDDTNHWNECACGDKANTAPHADENNDEKCDACGFEMKTPEAENPETSDVNITFVIIMMIAALGIFTAVRKRRYTA